MMSAALFRLLVIWKNKNKNSAVGDSKGVCEYSIILNPQYKVKSTQLLHVHAMIAVSCAVASVQVKGHLGLDLL